MKIIFWTLLFYFFVWPLLKKMMGGFGGSIQYDEIARNGTHDQRLVTATVVVGCRMAAVDETIDQRELQALFANLPAPNLETRNYAGRVLKDVLQGALREHDEAALFGYLNLDPRAASVYEPMLTTLGSVASADGVIGTVERRYFFLVARICGLSQQGAERYLHSGRRSNGSAGGHNKQHQSYGQSSAGNSQRQMWLDRLGLPARASNDEIKNRYRELARQLHPDRVNHIGGAIEDLVAKEFREIKEAYEKLIP